MSDVVVLCVFPVPFFDIKVHAFIGLCTLRNVHVYAVQKVQRVIVIGPGRQIHVPFLSWRAGVQIGFQIRGVHLGETAETRILDHVAIRTLEPGPSRNDCSILRDQFHGGRETILLFELLRYGTLKHSFTFFLFY